MYSKLLQPVEFLTTVDEENKHLRDAFWMFVARFMWALIGVYEPLQEKYNIK